MKMKELFDRGEFVVSAYDHLFGCDFYCDRYEPYGEKGA